jgi:hypothetical protein
VLGYAGVAAAATENVFIVVIDGLRKQEAFDDPTHQYTPNMWTKLRPQGTILRNFRSPHYTWGSPAMSSIWTGYWDKLTWANENNKISPERPTLFEYFRRQLGAQQDEVVVITGKPWVIKTQPSLDPEYSAGEFEPTVVGFATPIGQTDDFVFEEAARRIDTGRPRLCLIHLADVDLQGHTGSWDAYIAAVSNADRIVDEIWSRLQASDRYRDRTALIVLSDKGRHDDQHGGFQHHGDLCEGCQSALLLALGPSVTAGIEDSSYHELVDVAPTVGRLLGFSTPKAEGFPIRSLLSGVPAVPPRTGVDLSGRTPRWTTEVTLGDSGRAVLHGRSITPKIASWQAGGQLHVVWCDDTSGSWQLMYKLSDDNGRTWSPAVPISSGRDYRVANPSVAADNSAAGSAGRLHVSWEGFRNGSWQIFYRRKEPTDSAGTGWGAEELLSAPVTSANRFWSMFLDPDVMVDGVGWVHVVFVERDTDRTAPVRGIPFGNRMAVYYRVDHGAGWGPLTRISEGCIATLRPQLASGARGSAYAVWECFTSDIVSGYVTSNVRQGLAFSTSAIGWRQQFWPKKPESDSLAITPQLVVSTNIRQALWAEPKSGVFQLMGRHLVTGGAPPPIRQYTDQPRGVWAPAAATAPQGAVAVVAEDYSIPQGGGEISFFLRSNSGSVTRERLTANSGLSTQPAIAVDRSGAAHVVFQDNRSGDWKIYYVRRDP